MFNRIKARFQRPHNENAEWETLHNHGYRDVPRHVSQASRAELDRRTRDFARHYGLTRPFGSL